MTALNYGSKHCSGVCHVVKMTFILFCLALIELSAEGYYSEDPHGPKRDFDADWFRLSENERCSRKYFIQDIKNYPVKAAKEVIKLGNEKLNTWLSEPFPPDPDDVIPFEFLEVALHGWEKERLNKTPAYNYTLRFPQHEAERYSRIWWQIVLWKREEEKRGQKRNETLATNPKFKDGVSCIHGKYPPPDLTHRYYCVVDFNVTKFQRIISRKFGHRCANGTCNYHFKKYSLVCGTYNQAMTLLLSPAIVLLGMCSGLLW